MSTVDPKKIIISGSFENHTTDKRFSLAGFVFKAPCPDCHQLILKLPEYVSYKPFCKEFDLVLYCTNCDSNPTFKIKLNLTLEVVD